MSMRCSELSLSAREPLAATATTAERWLLVEAPGAWPRDVADEVALPEASRRAVDHWLERTPRSRLQFIRRPGRVGAGRLLAFVVTSEEHQVEVRRVELEHHAQLADVDLDAVGEPIDASLVLVCGHGSRDQCCALYGMPLYTILAEHLGDEEVWVSSHQGGHRFAPNLLVLPAGLQFGRVALDDARYLAVRALTGRIDLDRYRGRTCYERHVQAAEIAARRASRLEGVAEVSLAEAEDGVITFRTWDGAEYAILVEEAESPLVPASCGQAPELQLHFEAASLTYTPALSGGGGTRDR